MTRPMDLVRLAMLEGIRDSKQGVAWIKKNHNYSMFSHVFGQLRTRLLKTPQFRPEDPRVVSVPIPELPDPALADKSPAEDKQPSKGEVALNLLERRMELAIGVKCLLEKFDPMDIIEMVTIAACVRK